MIFLNIIIQIDIKVKQFVLLKVLGKSVEC